MRKTLKRMKKTNLLIAAILVLSFGLASCKQVSMNTNKSVIGFDQIKDSEYDSQLKLLQDFSLVAENEFLSLSINPITTEFSVKQKDNGEVWFSNPQDRTSDPLASAHTQSLLSSQIIVEYIDKANKKYNFNSYDNSVATGEFSFAKPKQGDGITILYELGETEKHYIVPSLIEKSRLESIIKTLSDEDKEYIQSRYNYTTIKNVSDELKELLTTNYPSIKNHDLYVLAGNMPDFIMKKLEERFAQAGYTNKELDTDNEMNDIQAARETVKIKIPVEIILEQDSFYVRIDHEKIESSGDVRFTKIDFLPYFGAGGVKDDGYMFIPDGSGAIIKFNNNKLQYQPISIPIYGVDMAIEKKTQILQQRQAYLPVFGLHRNGNGCLVIIESSDASAAINADISGRINSYNYIYPTFNLISYNTISLPYGDYEPVEIFSEDFLDTDIKVRYCVMAKEKTEYQDMAIYLKSHLTENGFITKNPNLDMNMLIEMIGAVDYKTSVAGIPVRRDKPLTSYNNVSNLVNILLEKGMNGVSIKYTGWQGGGLRNSLNDRIRLMNVLGSKSDFDKMIENANKSDIDLYLDSDIISLSKNGLFDHFYEKRDTARTLTNDLAYIYDYNLATRESVEETRRYLIKPATLINPLSSLLLSYKEYESNSISLGKAGKLLYSDFSLGNNTTRTATKDIIGDVFKKTSNSGLKILANGGNLYTLRYIDRLDESPLGSSGYYLTDYSVPFFQIATGGGFEYYGQPLNLSSDTSLEFMKILEYGSLISFKWTYSPNYELKDTDYNLYSTNYENWIDLALKTNIKIREIFNSANHHVLTGHERIAEGVYASHYGDNLTIITNYNNKAIDYKEFHVDGFSYQLIKAEVES